MIARMPHSIPCSAFNNLNMDGLLERMWDAMALVRVYTKKAHPCRRPPCCVNLLLSWHLRCSV